MTIPQSILSILEPFLIQWEGKEYHAYRDGAGVWTIGIGSTSNVRPGMVIDDAGIVERLQNDTTTAYNGVLAHLAPGIKLNNHQSAALISFVFNLGVGALAVSNLLKHINQEDYDNLEADFLAWDHMHVDGQLVESPGLRNRREAEYQLWSTPDEPTEA
jgi:lysozyme